MRHKSEIKRDAIAQATLRLVTELGFHGISMSKIAKEADVAAATIYIYFENKEDLINKLYLELKEVLVRDILQGYRPEMSTHSAFELLWRNSFSSLLAHALEFRFLEQFSNSPYISNVSKEEAQKLFEPVERFFHIAMERGDLRHMKSELIRAYFHAPIMFLAKQVIATGQHLDEKDVNIAILNSWQSMKA